MEQKVKNYFNAQNGHIRVFKLPQRKVEFWCTENREGTAKNGTKYQFTRTTKLVMTLNQFQDMMRMAKNSNSCI